MSQSSAIRQAQLESFLQFSPQESALSQLLSDAGAERKTAFHQATATRRGIGAAIRSARPVVKRTLNQADRTRRSAVKIVDNHVARLTSAGVQPYRAVIAAEAGGAKTRFAEMRRDSLNDLTRRQLEARSAESWMKSNARQTYNTTRSRIGQQQSALAAQKGAFTAATLEDLLGAEADRNLKLKDLKLKAQSASETARHNRATEANTRRGQDKSGGSGSSGKHNGFTHTQIESAKSKLRSATSDAEGFYWGHPGIRNASGSDLKRLTRDLYQLLLGKGYDPVIAYAGAQRYVFKGRVGPKTRQQLWDHYGFHVPGF